MWFGQTKTQPCLGRAGHGPSVGNMVRGGQARAAKWWCFPQPQPQLGIGLTLPNVGHPKCSCQILSKLPICPQNHRREAGAWLLGESALLKISCKICEMNRTLEVPICLHWLCRKPVQLIRFRHLTFRYLKTDERNPIIDTLRYWPDKGGSARGSLGMPYQIWT